MFSVRFTILLFIILIIPFLLRYNYGNRFELFPAILLPAGASKVHVGSGQFSVNYMVAMALKGNEWGKVDAVRLLHPIPATNHIYIFSRNFGLVENQDGGDKFLSRLEESLGLNKYNSPNQQAKASTRQWLSKRLKDQGFSGSIIKIVQKEDRISPSSGKVRHETIIKESILRLD